MWFSCVTKCQEKILQQSPTFINPLYNIEALSMKSITLGLLALGEDAVPDSEHQGFRKVSGRNASELQDLHKLQEQVAGLGLRQFAGAEQYVQHCSWRP